MIKKMEISMNQVVKVKLDERAINRKKKEIDIYNKKFNENMQLPIDSEGYYRDQLWCIMRDFGDMISLSYSPIYDFKIVIEF